eukprot:Gb_07944 [translate_table: standard]
MPPYAVVVGVCVDDMECTGKSIESAQSLDEFKTIRQLGYGDMGNVFLVLHIRSGKPVAMKVISKEVMRKRKSFKRAWIEKEILSKLDHPFLPTLFTKFESKEYFFLVMSYCSGGDLNVLRQNQKEKRFSESAARFYAAEVVLALEYLHQNGVVYRDLKPENILVQANGHIMLTDFDLSLLINNHPKHPNPTGKSRTQEESLNKESKSTSYSILERLKLAHVITQGCMNTCKSVEKQQDHRRIIHKSGGEKSSTVGMKKSLYGEQSHSFVGTEEYVAPEVLWGTGHGFPVDWWAFGILLYEMVYGKTPFKGCTRKDTFFNVLCKEPQFSGPWSPLRDLLQHLLVKEPSQRLGFKNGAEEIKKHAFFAGTRWNELEYVSRPPFVPPASSMENAQSVLVLDDDDAKRKQILEAF